MLLMRAQTRHLIRPLYQLVTRRNAHTAIRRFAEELGKTQPAIRMQANDVKIYTQPHEFKSTLLDMIRRARRRIFISSLYIGDSEQYLIDALQNSLKSNPSLQLSLHLDYNRSTRPGPASTASLLTPLLRQHPNRVQVNLFRSPKLKGLMAKYVPRRFDEGWGTWHAKIYGVDDEVLISGANLNESYFADRQDRYLHFTSTSLSNYCHEFLDTVSPVCYQLHAQTNTEGYDLHWPDSTTHPQQIEPKLGQSLRKFQSHKRQAEGEIAHNDLARPSSQGVTIFPIIQGGQFGVREEESAVDMLFRCLDEEKEPSLVDLTSGYFGLSKPYQELVRRSHADCRILCASPKANGFYGSSGISGRIPEGYTFLEQRFWRGISHSGRTWKPTASSSPTDSSTSGHGVQLHEWTRPGWTYHAKGIWVSPHQGEPPLLTLFGSTNLNSRSANLDTELAFVMVLPGSAEGEGRNGDEEVNGEVMALRRQLADEVAGLRQYAVPWEGEKRPVRLVTKILVNVVGGML